MILLFDRPGADTLAALLRRRGIYAIVRKYPTAVEREAVRLIALGPPECDRIVPLKREDEERLLLFCGTAVSGAALFCDAAAPDARIPEAAEALLARTLPGPTGLLMTRGLSFDLGELTLEAAGLPFPVTASEFHLLRCLALARTPLSAALLGEFCLGALTPRTVMTHIGHINRRALLSLGRRLVSPGRPGGYRLLDQAAR